MVMSVILLVNLLIALMSKTFDLVYESKDINYTYLFSRLVISYGQQSLLPPPLNMIHLAGKFIYAVWRGINGTCASHSQYRRVLLESDDMHPLRDEGEWKNRYRLDSNEEEKADLVYEVREFIEQHENESGSEVLQERWRAGFSQSLTLLARKLDTRMDSVERALGSSSKVESGHHVHTAAAH